MVDETDYYRVLTKFHQFLRPRTYVEIGVRHGESWQLARPDCRSIGVDPNPRITHKLQCEAALFKGTSDDLFSGSAVQKFFDNQTVDLSFIDGMHRFEYALRDFINLERVSAKNSIILLHDCLPIDEATSTREMNTRLWSGDVWKVVVCLKQERPDLQIDVLDSGPTGLAVVQGLDPDNMSLSERLAEVSERYIDSSYVESLGSSEEQKRRALNVCSASEQDIERLCGPANRFHGEAPAPFASHRRSLQQVGWQPPTPS